MTRDWTAALLAIMTAGAVPAAMIQEARAQDAGEGEGLYALYCAACHGATARGDGPTAEIMVLQPADLTRLSAGNGGTFPVARVVSRIDGRDVVLSHGAPMPLFGPFFDGAMTSLKTAAGQPVLTSKPVADLVVWLETLQVTQ